MDHKTEFLHLIEAIYSTYGYDLRNYAFPSLYRRIIQTFVRSDCKTFKLFHHKVISEPEFFLAVFEELMVVVTDMFRDPEFYLFLRSHIIPILRTYPLLKIWHSGCATGEEAYASAIIMTETGLYDRTQIYATDVSYEAIEQAKTGSYALDHLKKFEENYIQSGGTFGFHHFYQTRGNHLVMKPSLKRNMVFFQHNLATDHAFGEMHLIFCRNVLIYFDAELKDRIVKKFAESLVPLGFLCLGLNERLPRAFNTKLSLFSKEAHIYRHVG